MSESTAPISFMEKYQHEEFEKCCTISKILPDEIPPGKPNFIDQFLVNGRLVNFLGYRERGEAFCDNLRGKKYLEIKAMVIPEQSTFINANDLWLYLQEELQDGAIIPIEELIRQQRIEGEKIGENLLLRTCIGVHEDANRWFHPCMNYKGITTFRKGDSSCCWPANEVYFDQENRLQNSLLPFYISWKDIKNYKHDKHWELKNRLLEYFNHYGQKLHHDVNAINKYFIEGVFLFPRIQVDQSIIYTCFLNQPTVTYEGSIKETLCYWFDKYDKFNEYPETREVVLKGDDLFLCNIEQWSIKIGCDATPFLVKIDPQT